MFSKKKRSQWFKFDLKAPRKVWALQPWKYVLYQYKLWLANQTPNILWYPPPNNSHGICIRNSVIIVAGVYELKSCFCATLSQHFNVYKNNYSPLYRWLSVNVYLAASRFGEYQPLTTSTSVDICWLFLYPFKILFDHFILPSTTFFSFFFFASLVLRLGDFSPLLLPVFSLSLSICIINKCRSSKIYSLTRKAFPDR